jgi:hypothetical protein
MADAAYVKSFLGSLSADAKLALSQAFTYVLTNFRLGGLNLGKRASNFQWYWFMGTTPAVANTEFSIAHNQGQIPTCVIPVLPLDQIGAQLVPLQVSRAADASRVYLKSSSTSAAVYVLVEF